VNVFNRKGAKSAKFDVVFFCVLCASAVNMITNDKSGKSISRSTLCSLRLCGKKIKKKLPQLQQIIPGSDCKIPQERNERKHRRLHPWLQPELGFVVGVD
jgi:hypothetical protein